MKTNETIDRWVIDENNHTVDTVVGSNRYPNLYGDEIKIMPDIGEIVNEAGILCAFRSVKMLKLER